MVIELVVGFAVCLTLVEDGRPGESCLRSFEDEKLKKVSVSVVKSLGVVPFLVVVGLQERVPGVVGPDTAGLAVAQEREFRFFGGGGDLAFLFGCCSFWRSLIVVVAVFFVVSSLGRPSRLGGLGHFIGGDCNSSDDGRGTNRSGGCQDGGGWYAIVWLRL